jgi:hypothetical protein
MMNIPFISLDVKGMREIFIIGMIRAVWRDREDRAPMTIITLMKLPPLRGSNDHWFRDVRTGQEYRYVRQDGSLPCRLRAGEQLLAALPDPAWQPAAMPSANSDT